MRTMPNDCCLIQVKLIKPGDRVRFYMTGTDYTASEVEIDNIGHIKHRTERGGFDVHLPPRRVVVDYPARVRLNGVAGSGNSGVRSPQRLICWRD